MVNKLIINESINQSINDVCSTGGQSIQEECLDHVKSTGQLSAGDVFVSKAGNLPCKAIAHALGPVWKGGTHNEEDVLQNAIQRCLEETEKRGYSSIAIPALSTGAFNYPAVKACAAIVEQVVNQSGLKSVKKVVLCDINQATVKCFVMALQAEVKDVKIHCKLRFPTVHLTVLRLTNMVAWEK